jgi:hypothetical protein
MMKAAAFVLSAAALAAMVASGITSPASAYWGPPSLTAWLKNETSVRLRAQFNSGQWVEVAPYENRRFTYQHGVPHMLVEYRRDGHWAYACATSMERTVSTLTVRGDGSGATCSVSETTFF